MLALHRNSEINIETSQDLFWAAEHGDKALLLSLIKKDADKVNSMSSQVYIKSLSVTTFVCLQWHVAKPDAVGNAA